MHPALLLLILAPIFVHRWARRRRPRQVWLLTGLAFGAIIAPFSLALYTSAYLATLLPPALRFLGFIPGAAGFVLTRIHEFPAQWLISSLKEVPTADAKTYFLLELVNAVVWAGVYGVLGWMLDRRRWRGSHI